MSAAETPCISVVFPTFNRKDYLVQAIDSVLAQRGVELEVVVSDNASDDGTRELMDRYASDRRVRYFRNDVNLGMVANWRLAINERARGEWFVLMSDDDYFTDDGYLREAWLLVERYQPKLVYAGGTVLDTSSGALTPMLPPSSGLIDGKRIFASRGSVAPMDFLLCNVLFKHSDAARLDFLHNEDNLCADSELFLKLALEGEVAAVRKAVCVYRLHPGNLSKRIRTSPRLLRGNLEYLVLPYAYGVQLGVDPALLQEYRSNARLDEAVRDTLILIELHDRDASRECRRFLQQHAPQVLRAVETSWNFRWRRLRTLHFTSSLRAEYLAGRQAQGSR